LILLDLIAVYPRNEPLLYEVREHGLHGAFSLQLLNNANDARRGTQRIPSPLVADIIMCWVEIKLRRIFFIFHRVLNYLLFVNCNI
jgi:hypothetical protein